MKAGERGFRIVISMKAVVFLFLPWLASAAEIPKGGHVLLKMVNSVSTRTAREGDQVYLQTAVPIAIDGQIVVPAGSYVQGIVSHAQRSGRVAGRAELGVRLETLTLASGKVLKFSPRLSSVDAEGTDQKVVGEEDKLKQGADHAKDTAQIAIMAGSGAAIGALADRSWKGAGIGAAVGGAVGFATVLMTRGREVELKQGSTLDVVFDRAIAVE
jgi:hypothetical protein